MRAAYDAASRRGPPEQPLLEAQPEGTLMAGPPAWARGLRAGCWGAYGARALLLVGAGTTG